MNLFQFIRDSFDEMIEMRGNNPYANCKTACLVEYHGSFLTYFTRLLKQGFFWWDDQNEGQWPYANFKTTCFVKYLGSMLTDFHETSITGILLMRLLKISCVWKTFCIILCILHLIYTHRFIHICIHVHMLICLATTFLCQMQSWNQCACYILAHHCAILIPHAIILWILKGVMRNVICWVNSFK